ncbi:putative RNA-dependent RNA polymerase 1 [Amylocarpus encephaloides]|uniref:RNA-dependent RNA polymerase n=1 Tax=Amylocarpus encephaloides TaxID=45428 RepID=A0A9P8C2N2_9HELO|nr:putative RNA-dependent RNA polymerase 1 [Amylocarpus encephaloides]
MVEVLRKRITVEFLVTFKDPRHDPGSTFVSDSPVGKHDRDNRYMFQIPFDQLKLIQQVDSSSGGFKLLISSLDSPPPFYRRRHVEFNDADYELSEALTWSEFEDSWYRQTDMVYDPFSLGTKPIALHKEQPFIDIGRWTNYLLHFEPKLNESSSRLSACFAELRHALQDFNIETIPLDGLSLRPAQTAKLWSYIGPAHLLLPSSDLQHLDPSSSEVFLPFEVRYQLDVCISRELLNEHNISREFIVRLAEMASADSNKARNILEYVAEEGERVYDPMAIFQNEEALSFSSKTEIPHYCAYSRKATITPSTMYFSTPTVETTNRVLRYYHRENRDGRFLRVQFTDEAFQGRLNSCVKRRNDELFTRVYRTLRNGIQVGERHHKFLAFGNSQFRENGAYFFHESADLTCAAIRKWMGSFSHINVVAKYAARLGQCFSTTRAINGLSSPKIVTIPDIEINNYTFTDGVGKISPFLAQMISAELGLRCAHDPSAFQFRLGGCKGILVTWPDAKDREVHIRKSQQKFTAVYNGLEIIRCSHYSVATLNRQTITILSDLGVKDDVFLKLMSDQLSEYQDAMDDKSLAGDLLCRFIDDNQMTINIAQMISNGFMESRDPFVLSLLHLWRAWSIKLLKEKAKIVIENGAFVLGCVDETGILRGYNTPKTLPGETPQDLPQIFIQVPKKGHDPKNPEYNVIEGNCLVGRNPSLHPGDLRICQAVNVPELHHLRDVLVFPSTGERDVPSMCSGGDLDGDDYFVIWDKDLQPPEWNCTPMSYAVLPPKEQNNAVTELDLMKFFVRYMKNDSLPTIAHAHLAQADYLDQGVKDPRCIELARLHSKAVDYVKTGHPAEMPKALRPRKWPHYMEKKHKPKDAIYHSEKILGQLYDKVQSVDFVPQWQQPFDKRILSAYKLDDASALLKTARQIKTKYDLHMRRIMAQQEIKTEFEIWSTFVLSKSRIGSDYKMQEEMGRISEALKDQFRAICVESAGGKDFPTLGPFVACMYKVTKEELDIALAECRSTKLVGGRQVPRRKMEARYMPLISFPWLFEKELGRIATGVDPNEGEIDLPLLTLKSDRPRQRQTGDGANDAIQQEDGFVVHRGEVLDLFRPDAEDLIVFDEDDEGYEEGSMDDPALSTIPDSDNNNPMPVHDGSPEDSCPPFTPVENSHSSSDVGSLIYLEDSSGEKDTTSKDIAACISEEEIGESSEGVDNEEEERETLVGEKLTLKERTISLDLEESPLEKLARMYNS